MIAQLEGLSRSERRRREAQLERDNKSWPLTMTTVPLPWPYQEGCTVLGVWRSRSFLAQYVKEQSGQFRLSVCRTSVSGDCWKDGISWEELQTIKSQCGLGNLRMVEVYPQDDGVVNVANMRHLFCTPEVNCIGWRL